MDEKTIITYQSESTTNPIEVRIEGETVWLNRNQIAILFDRDIKTIGKHINNALKEELSTISVVANFATTTDLSSSPSLKTLLMCFPIVFTSLPNTPCSVNT